MLTDKEKNQKLIELQLGDLSESNMAIIANHVNNLIAGQNYKAMVESKIEADKLKETYHLKSFDGKKVVTEEVRIVKMPEKKKRPRIVSISNNIEVNISTVNHSDDVMISKHMEGLRKMFKDQS